MPISCVPGQQATPNPINAIPATRAAMAATSVSSSPNSNRPIQDGKISNADAGHGFAHRGKYKRPFHRADPELIRITPLPAENRHGSCRHLGNISCTCARICQFAPKSGFATL